VTRRRAARAAPPSSRLGAALGLLLAVLPAVAHAQTFEARLAACLACHGVDGASRIPGTPSLGGQPAFFLITQLFLFREGRRDNEAMTAAATPTGTRRAKIIRCDSPPALSPVAPHCESSAHSKDHSPLRADYGLRQLGHAGRLHSLDQAQTGGAPRLQARPSQFDLPALGENGL